MIPYGPGQKNNYVEFITLLKDLVSEGKVPESRIDDAVRRILLVKSRMHLFDHPFSDPALTSAVGSAEHRQVARECVQKSLVLLKNEKNTLPLSKQAKRLVLGGSGRRRPGNSVRRLDDHLARQDGQRDARRHDAPGRHPPGRRT